MPALPADIAAGSRDQVTASWTDSSIAARYPSARDGSASPAVGYFDSVTDAGTVITARAALLGVERRRFTAKAEGITLPTISTAIPTVQLIDSEQVANGTFLTSRIEVDFEAETTSYELFG